MASGGSSARVLLRFGQLTIRGCKAALALLCGDASGAISLPWRNAIPNASRQAFDRVVGLADLSNG